MSKPICQYVAFSYREYTQLNFIPLIHCLIAEISTSLVIIMELRNLKTRMSGSYIYVGRSNDERIFGAHIFLS